VKIGGENDPVRQLRLVPPQQGGEGGGAGRLAALIAAAFGVGVVTAKMLDWRGHAHPRI
jgi:hypothetical protein